MNKLTLTYIIGTIIGTVLTIGMIIGLIQLGFKLLAYIILSLTTVGSMFAMIALLYVVIKLLKSRK